ncbi:AI-2E family transporter [Longivirga aurantiaca]|uniref:AI-2E family transporter n=1 Tax=Longivirga aurantiaca TaxID=1837743 RepID=A0ABW1SV35_9ACTN
MANDDETAGDQIAAAETTPGTAPGVRAADRVKAPEREATVVFDLGNLRRVAAMVLVIAAVVWFFMFVLEDAGGVLFTIIMAFALSVAMEPAVGFFARRGMRRGLATGLIMILALLGTVVFFLIFGNLLVEQLLQLITSLPDVVTNVIDWINRQFSTDLSVEKILDSIGLTPGAIASWAAGAAGGIFGAIFTFLGSVFNVFTLLLFTFYLSADAPRLRRWIAKFLPRSAQKVNSELWDTAIQKAGGYVAARLVLAFINGSTTALVLYLIGMPYWLPLGIWTGIVAQFVPTIGTYIAIALPVLIGVLSDDPKDGLIALVWALLYQQVENLTIEPRISAKAVDLHPAVSFGAVMFGASLFGAAGALLAVPVAAIVMSFLETYAPTYDVVEDPASSG